MGLILWLLQRMSAIAIMCAVVLTYIYFSHVDFNFISWTNYFRSPLYGTFFCFAWCALLLHAWIGVWTIITDYVPSRKLRFILLGLYGSFLMLSAISALHIRGAI